MLRQAIITSKTANAIVVANTVIIVANERTYITPYANVKSPSHCWPGQVKAERIEGRIRPYAFCKTLGRTLVKWRRRRDWDLFIFAKELFDEATASPADIGAEGTSAKGG